MAKLKTHYVTVDAELMYARVFERNRDMGNDFVDHSDTDGMYKVDLIVDEEGKQAMVNAGIPETAMGNQMFKPTEDGRYKYRAKRPHLSKFGRDENGNPFVVGPPEVVDLNNVTTNDAGRPVYEPWDSDVNLGNGTRAKVKLQIVFGRAPIVSIIKIGVEDLEEYEEPDELAF